jgi:hypothetical protein
VGRLEGRVWWMGKWTDGDFDETGLKMEVRIERDCEMDTRSGCDEERSPGAQMCEFKSLYTAYRPD